jgi:hypothetical protein
MKKKSGKRPAKYSMKFRQHECDLFGSVTLVKWGTTLATFALELADAQELAADLQAEIVSCEDSGGKS